MNRLPRLIPCRSTVLAFLLAMAAVAGFLPPVPASAQTPDQAARWRTAQIRPESSLRVNKAVERFRRTRARYERVASMRSPSAPAAVIFALHLRESDADFTCHAHEGSPLTVRTRDVPKGRLPSPATPPFTWEQSAEDAYFVCDRLQTTNWNDVAAALQAIEAFNGLGYQRFHPSVPSPYLWGGTTLYNPPRGKYTADGRFDPLAIDKQLGCAAVLKRMKELGIFTLWKR